MKHAKKLLAVLLVALLTLSLSATAFAATITVENAVAGETYDAYKLLEYTSAGDAYSYYLETSFENYAALKTLLEGAGFEFTESADGTQAFVSNADELTDGAAIAAYLYENLDTLKTVAIAKSEGNVADDEGKVEMGDLAEGYWFVTSSLGSLCTLQSYDDEELVVEKNEVITPPEKEASQTNYQVGDTVSYTITYTDVAGTNNDLILTDTMSAGLTFQESTLKVNINGTETTEGWTKTFANNVLTITVDAATMDKLEKDQTIVVTYDAVVNSDASLDGTEWNTVVARTSEQETTPVKVEVEFGKITVNKTDGTDALKGAQFKLYRTDAAESLDHVDVKLRQLTETELAALGTEDEPFEPAANTVYYTVDPNGENLIDMAQKDGEDYLYSSAVIFGLDKDSTYYLEETKAPEGYNKLDEEKEVKAGDDAKIDVVNNAGSVLPSTGGIGTTIFYVVGGLLVAAALVMLITKKRMSSEA